MPLRALFVDFDAYFASVEQQDDPALRGRPVAVVPVMADTSCCIAVSYPAKRHGIKTGTPVAEAKRRCPGLVLRLARHTRYIEVHHQLVQAVQSCIPVDAVLSIDEMACTLTGSWCAPERARGIAGRIKAAVREVGDALTCSIGIAPNRFLAKTASKMDKPDGLTVIQKEDLPQALYRLQLGDLNGIGPRMRARLAAAGIHTVADLYAASAASLRQVWGGVEGERMYARLRGETVPEPETARGSIGHSHVLPPELREDEAALAVLHRLLQKAAWRLRHLGYFAGGMGLELRYLDGEWWRGRRRLEATQDTLVLTRAMTALWDQRPRRRLCLLGVGVTLTHLCEARGQSLELFPEAAARGRLFETVDRLNARFGRNALYFGGAHRALEAAPMRIAFTHVPDPRLER
ncbi:DNA polymerase Y family protein [Pelomicrobium sp.]|jgi:DNA polymerase-4|uniref:DNA polymerase Y family protein n=1 Tax=Pelomicrobium sp. TaxID=2815319 RepID=UPI002FDE2B8C